MAEALSLLIVQVSLLISTNFFHIYDFHCSKNCVGGDGSEWRHQMLVLLQQMAILSGKRLKLRLGCKCFHGLTKNFESFQSHFVLSVPKKPPSPLTFFQKIFQHPLLLPPSLLSFLLCDSNSWAICRKKILVK